MLWTVEGKLVKTLSGHTLSVFPAVFPPDSELVLTASRDKTAMLWTVEGLSCEPFKTLSGHTDEVRSAVFSPDGELILTASQD